MTTYWSSGYVADIGYTFGYYTELNPLRVRLAFLNAGLVPPEIVNACELGFGQGLSINLHAAAESIQWSGTDFNPSHAGFAQELARTSDSGAKLSDESFEQYCLRTDLPDFDLITLHGIWSWVSDANRRVIVDFIRRKLKVGGVLYISYNTQPGWAAMVPLRELLTEHVEVNGGNGNGVVNRIEGALAFTDQLFATNPLYFLANPVIAERIKQIKEQNRYYLAHEYFNRDWEPMSFTKLANWLKPCKVKWACSANYLDAIDAINLSAEQQKILNSISDPIFRQTVRDFCVNQQFRKDYWVKGPRQLQVPEQLDALRQLKVVLAKPHGEVILKVTGSLGEATMQGDLYTPILEQLSDYKPKTIGALEQTLNIFNIGLVQLVQAMMVLAATDTIQAVQEDAVVVKVKKRTDRLNSFLIKKARTRQEINFLVSPVTGGGIAVSRFHQLFLLALQQGKKHPEDWAKMAWSIVEGQGQRLLKDGKALETADENLAEMTTQAHTFAEKYLAVLKALQIA